jgi:hypothetical protein
MKKTFLHFLLFGIIFINLAKESRAQVEISARGGAMFVMPEKYGYSTAYNMNGNFGVEINYKSYFFEYFTYGLAYAFTSVIEDPNQGKLYVLDRRWFGTAHNFRLGRQYEFKNLLFKYSATFATVSDDQFILSQLPDIGIVQHDADINLLSAEFEVKTPLIYDVHFFFGGGPNYMADWKNKYGYLSITIFTGLSYDFTFKKKD